MRQSVAYNTLVQYFGKGVGLVVSFFTTTLLLRALGVDGYGNYSIVYAIAGIFVSFADLGFFWYTVKELSGLDEGAKEERLREIFATRLSTLVIVALAFVLFSLIVSIVGTYPIEVRTLLIWAVLFVLSAVLNNFFAALYQIKMRMDYPLIADVAGKLLVLGVVAYGFFHNQNFFLLAASPIFGMLLTALISGLLLRRYFYLPLRLPWKNSLAGFPQLISYGIIAVLTLLYFKVDILILSLLKPSVDVGIYSAPYRIIELSLLLPGMFISSLYPSLSRAGADKEGLGKLSSLGLQLLICIALPVVVFGELFSSLIVRVIGGKEFLTASTVDFLGYSATSVTVLQVLMLFVLISFITNIITPVLFALSKNRELVRIYVIALVVNVVLNLILIPNFSYLAAAVVTILTEVVALCLGMRIIRQNIRITLNWQLIWRWICILAVTVVVIALLRAAGWNEFLILGVAVLIYSGLLILTKSYDQGWKYFFRSTDT